MENGVLDEALASMTLEKKQSVPSVGCMLSALPELDGEGHDARAGANDMTAFAKMASIRANTKRLPAFDSNDIRGAPELYLRQIPCTPLDPVSAEVKQSYGLDAAIELLQTFVEGGKDIVQGDTLIPLSGFYQDKELRIERVGEWVWRNTSYAHLILEEDKG